MRKFLQEHLKLHKISKKWLATFAIVIIGIGVICGVTLAKYYANNSNKGVAAAANYYFSSNFLDEPLADDPLVEGDEEWKTVYNTEAWTGISEYAFELKIRNYQNQLLYNSQNLNIEYKITFELLENDGGTYKVQYDTGESQVLTAGNPVTFGGSDNDQLVINGGSAKAHAFKIFVDVPEGFEEDYRSQGIKVVAEITGPDFLAQTNKKIGAIFYAGLVDATYQLLGEYDFEVPTLGEWSSSQKATVNAMAAFPYTITYQAGEDNAAHKIKISWDSSKLQLNYFDENYPYIQPEEDEDGTKLSYYIEVTMQPNDKLQLVFYRTDGFNLDEITPAQFQSLICIDDEDGNGDLSQTE